MLLNSFTIAAACVISVASIAPAQTPAYTTIDYPGSTGTTAWGINNLGDVVGVYSLPDKTNHGFLWSGGKLSSIDFPGASGTDTWGINDHGDIVGDYTINGVTRSFVLTHGRFVPVDVPGATLTAMAGINNSGGLVGIYTLPDSSSHTIMIKGDVLIKADDPGSAVTQGNGLNDAGDVAANCTITGVTHGCVKGKGAFTLFDYPDAAFTGAYGISGAGDIVGRYRDAAGATHGFLYSGGKYTSIDIPGSTATAASAINSVGDFVGRYTSGGINHAFVMNSPVTSYTVSDLGVLYGGSFSQPSQGNTDNGLIAGVSDTPDGSQHAVLWQFGQTIDLAAKGLGGPNSLAVGLNENALVVGLAETADSDPEDFCAYHTGRRCVPFLWQSGAMSPLPTLGGSNGFVSAVNRNGAMAGAAQTAVRDSSCPAPLSHDYEAVVWGPAPGQIRPLRPLPGDTVGVAFWINDLGQVVGTSGTCSNTLPYGVIVGPHAVLWDSDGTPIDLGNLGGSVDVSLFAVGNRATYINNKSEVVGGSTLTGNKTAHAFRWTRDTGMKDLGVLPGDDNSGAIAINERGEVVGVSNDTEGNGRAFIWRNGLMSDLNTLVPAESPLYLVAAFGINGRGEIVGFGATESGDIHAFVATPNEIDPRSRVLGVSRQKFSPETLKAASAHRFGKTFPLERR
jgi:probable HAF family extracellular repeat protein